MIFSNVGRKNGEFDFILYSIFKCLQPRRNSSLIKLTPQSKPFAPSSYLPFVHPPQHCPNRSILICRTGDNNRYNISCTSSLACRAHWQGSDRNSWSDRTLLLRPWYSNCRLLKDDAVWVWRTRRWDERTVVYRQLVVCERRHRP